MKEILFLFGFTIFCVGCSSPTDSGNTVANHPLQNSEVFVSAVAQVETPATAGAKAVFSATCQIGYTDQSDADSVFNSAEITVDRMPLTQQGSAGTFYCSGLRLAAGDSAVFVVKHPIIGTIVQSLRVPPSLIDCIIQPKMPPKGTANTSTEYAVAWGTGAVGAAYYLLNAVCYDSLRQVVTTWSTRSGSNTLTFPSWVFEESSGAPFPFVDITVLPFNSISYPGFARGSQFSVSSASYKEYSNL